ncbi:22411_t:CDS:1, partial [Gigaspora rosea]
QQFLKQIANLRPQIAVYKRDAINQVIPLRLLPNVPEIVPVTYDKLIFYANDGIKKFWGSINKNQIQQKSQASIYVSEFICETIGQLCLSQEEKEANDLLSDSK